jgi:hypothetical protein
MRGKARCVKTTRRAGHVARRSKGRKARASCAPGKKRLPKRSVRGKFKRGKARCVKVHRRSTARRTKTTRRAPRRSRIHEQMHRARHHAYGEDTPIYADEPRRKKRRKGRRRQTAKQRAASLKNLRKARRRSHGRRKHHRRKNPIALAPKRRRHHRRHRRHNPVALAPKRRHHRRRHHSRRHHRRHNPIALAPRRHRFSARMGNPLEGPGDFFAGLLGVATGYSLASLADRYASTHALTVATDGSGTVTDAPATGQIYDAEAPSLPIWSSWQRLAAAAAAILVPGAVSGMVQGSARAFLQLAAFGALGRTAGKAMDDAVVALSGATPPTIIQQLYAPEIAANARLATATTTQPTAIAPSSAFAGLPRGMRGMGRPRGLLGPARGFGAGASQVVGRGAAAFNAGIPAASLQGYLTQLSEAASYYARGVYASAQATLFSVSNKILAAVSPQVIGVQQVPAWLASLSAMTNTAQDPATVLGQIQTVAGVLKQLVRYYPTTMFRIGVFPGWTWGQWPPNVSVVGTAAVITATAAVSGGSGSAAGVLGVPRARPMGRGSSTSTPSSGNPASSTTPGGSGGGANGACGTLVDPVAAAVSSNISHWPSAAQPPMNPYTAGQDCCQDDCNSFPIPSSLPTPTPPPTPPTSYPSPPVSPPSVSPPPTTSSAPPVSPPATTTTTVIPTPPPAPPR